MSTSLEDIFATSTTAEENGVWVELSSDHKFLIRAFSAKAAVDLREKLSRQYQALLRAGGKIPDEKNDEINLRVLAEGILADWQIVEERDESGAVTRQTPYSPEAALQRMKKMPRFANWIAQQSLDAQNYKDALDASSLGN